MEINHRYNFNTLVPAVLGVKLTNVKLLATLTYGVANTIQPMLPRHRAIYPHLPQGTVDDPTAYTYYMFKTDAGDDIILADVWIDTNSIVEVSGVSFDVQFRDVTSDQFELVRTALHAAGLTQFTMVNLT